MAEHDPNYVPSGPNTPNNPYYKKINHVKIARQDSSRAEYLTGPTIVLTGLDTDGKAVIGTEPTISFEFSPPEDAPTLIEQYWSLNNLANGAEETFGFGVNPTSLAGADNQPLWLIAQDSAGAYYEVSTTIKQQAPVVVGPLPAQVLTEDTGSYTIDGSLYLTGGGITYSVPSAPTGVSVDALSGLITINANETGVVVGGTITLSGTSSGGGPFTTAGTLDVSANVGIVAIVEPVASTLWDEDLLSALDNLDTFEDPANYTSAGTATVVAIFRSGPDLTLTNRDELLLEGEAWEITFRVTDNPSGDIRDYVVSGTTQKLWSLTSIGTNKISAVIEAGVPDAKVMPKVNDCVHGMSALDFRTKPVLVCGVQITGDTTVPSTLTRIVDAITVPDLRSLDAIEDQWTRGGVAIPLANDDTYVTDTPDIGQNIRDTVIARDSALAENSPAEVSNVIQVDGGAGYTQTIFNTNATAWLDGMAHADGSTKVAGSIWLNIPSDPAQFSYIWGGGTNNKGYVGVNPGGVFDFRMLDNVASGATIFRSQTAAFPLLTPLHLFWEVECGVASQFIINGVQQPKNTDNSLTKLEVRDAPMQFMINGAKTVVTNVEFADFLMTYDDAGGALDPVALYNGGVPPDPEALGVTPLVLMGGSMSVADLNAGVNLGTGGVWNVGSGTFS